MNILEAIRTRRSIGKVLPEPVPRETIEQLLNAAVHAPNHHRNLPWRFWALTGAAREEFGDVLGAIAREKLADPSGADVQDQVARQRAKALRAPVIVVVAVDQTPAQKVLKIENIEAGAAAVQNLLLAAHALGLGAIWRTGAAAYHPAMKAHFGLAPEDEIIGFVYIGYPAKQPEPVERSANGSVSWWGWES